MEGAVDVILSSGFLAFASHCGVLLAVEQAGLPLGGFKVLAENEHRL
jgi:hypothetical protein